MRIIYVSICVYIYIYWHSGFRGKGTSVRCSTPTRRPSVLLYLRRRPSRDIAGVWDKILQTCVMHCLLYVCLFVFFCVWQILQTVGDLLPFCKRLFVLTPSGSQRISANTSLRKLRGRFSKAQSGKTRPAPGRFGYSIIKGHAEVKISNGSWIWDPPFEIVQIGTMRTDRVFRFEGHAKFHWT